MEMPRLSKSVEKVIRLDSDGAGHYTAVTVYEKPEGKKKKGSPVLRKIDKGNMRVLKAQREFLDDYKERHDKSNLERKDGWILDLPANVIEAQRKARKELKLRRLLEV